MAQETGRWKVHLPPTVRQWSVVIVLAALALALGHPLSNARGPYRDRYVWMGGGAFVAYLLAMAYAIFLRVQSTNLDVTEDAVTLLGRVWPRGPVELLRWRHFLHEGAVLVIHGPGRPLRLGVIHSLPAPGWRTLGHAHARVDAILTPPDFSDVAAALRVVELGWEPPAKASGLAVMSPWFVTILALCVFGGFCGVSGVGQRLTATREGALFVQALTFGIVAVGLVLTMSRPSLGRSRTTPAAPRGAAFPQLAHATHARPSFPRGMIIMISWLLLSTGIACAIIGPGWLVSRQFERRVDVPGCRAVCETEGLPFTLHESTKHGEYCLCGGKTIAHHTYLFGESTKDHVLDWAARAGSVIGAEVVWFALLVTGGILLSRRRARFHEPQWRRFS